MTRSQGTTIQVLIGQVHLTQAPHRLATVLGSCVGLVLYDFDQRIAGMAHILLPDSDRVVPGMPGRHVAQALNCLKMSLNEMGCNNLKAWLAGGATMFSTDPEYAGSSVGKANIEQVIAGLRHNRIPLIEKDVGGNRGRRVTFDPATGTMTSSLLSIDPLRHQMIACQTK